eukprot:381162-Rhodomonas_salina.1
MDGNPGRATWDAARKSLLISVCGDPVLVDHTFAFSVGMTNPEDDQAAPNLNISLSGNLVNIPVMPMFAIVNPVFIRKRIEQSTPVAGHPSTLWITLKINVELSGSRSHSGSKSHSNSGSTSGSSVIVINGMDGAVVHGNYLSLAGDDAALFCDDTNGTSGRARWEQADATMHLFICAGKRLLPLTEYFVSTTIENPVIGQPSPEVNITASGTMEILTSPIQKPGTTLMGVVDGANPLLIVVPEFSTRNISQTYPVAGSQNHVLMLLISNINVASGSSIEVKGLQGAVLEAAANVRNSQICHPNPHPNNTLSLSGFSEWDAASSTLRMAVCANATLHASTSYMLNISIQNPVAA